eukprot:c13177_g4_i4.p1 GENE.c13177_g4_i4~~c13177_g4_i4.p1  ORF type:complete len:297 (+),score=45.79 c13177_g4_i4:70-960(+)
MSTPHPNDNQQRPNNTTTRIGLGPSSQFPGGTRSEFNERAAGQRPFPQQPRRGNDSFGGERSAGPRSFHQAPPVPTNPQHRSYSQHHFPIQQVPLPPPQFVQFAGPPNHPPNVQFGPFPPNNIHNPPLHPFNEFPASHTMRDNNKLPELDPQSPSDVTPLPQHMLRSHGIPPDVQAPKPSTHGHVLSPHPAIHLAPSQPIAASYTTIPTPTYPNTHAVLRHLPSVHPVMVPGSNSPMYHMPAMTTPVPYPFSYVCHICFFWGFCVRTTNWVCFVFFCIFTAIFLTAAATTTSTAVQ